MADEVNNTQAAEAPTSTDTQGGAAQEAAPAQEQQNAFQRFLGSLLGSGKAAPPAPAGDADTAPPPAPQQEPEGKTYTEADLQSRLEAVKAEWAAQQQEQARLEKLPPEERAKAEADAKDKELEGLRAQLLQRDLKDAALKQLEKEGFPTGLADLLTYTDKESMEKSIDRKSVV